MEKTYVKNDVYLVNLGKTPYMDDHFTAKFIVGYMENGYTTKLKYFQRKMVLGVTS